ncbi:MAG: OadG family protein [Lachnospiraceae bacterium]
MTVPESLLVALFCIAMVFFVLVCLCMLIKLFSFCLQKIAPENTSVSAKTDTAFKLPQEEETFSSGSLKLIDVDEPTAAMIMAIVSDESGIPLSELCFTSIRLVPPQNAQQDGRENV